MQAIYALTIVFVYYAAGEVVSSYTKAKIPSSVARSIIILTTFWTGLVPTSVFEDAGYSSFAMLMVGIMITGMGNTIDFTEAKRQIKTVVVAILGMSAGVALILTLGSVIIERSTAFAGAPIYAGGQAALLLIMTEMADKGEAGAQVVVICTLCHYIQQYYGLPVSSFFLRRAGRRLLSNEQELRKYLTDEHLPVYFIKIKKSIVPGCSSFSASGESCTPKSRSLNKKFDFPPQTP